MTLAGMLLTNDPSRSCEDPPECALPKGPETRFTLDACKALRGTTAGFVSGTEATGLVLAVCKAR